MTMIIIGILAAVAIPRFFDTDVFRARGFADEVQATLRYAQKVAIAQHRFVCVSFGTNSVTLTTGSTSSCGLPLASPSGNIVACDGVLCPVNQNTFGILNANASYNLPLPANFGFDCLGRPRDLNNRSCNDNPPLGVLPPVAGQTYVQNISVSGYSGFIYIEAETGYVHQ